jgi:class 3 adenylate cyclase/tetratricopeptide (TPR) repeat protein
MERKTATVLFVDLVDSTGLVASADPEVVRRRVSQYFELASHCIESHGGTVEKFAGDAVMAAFGVPQAHEDDAERAVRSALSIVEGVQTLGLQARAGVESGEVVVEDVSSTFVTGEAVNVAARLQQSAPAGGVVLGPGTRRLTLATVEVEDRGSVEVRAGAQVWSWLALGTIDGRRRRPAGRFVGRGFELDLLRNLQERAVRDRRTQLATVFGDPGVGKSRVVSEFADGVERATILTGRALPYGEGIAYWPIVSMIKASAGITDDDPAAEAFEKLRVSCESDAVADLLAVALGVLGVAEAGDGSSEEIAWAALRWAEQLADAQPLVLVFEDLHWADERLLDLVEHLARSLSSSPALIVCVARKELLDTRPGWGGGNARAAALELGPLTADESVELAAALLPDDAPAAVRGDAVRRAEGNPLFLEETARMLLEGDVTGIPDTLQTLIAARIDLLDPPAKRTLQAAAVIGRVFWRGALEQLVGPGAGEAVDELCDRELIVPEERSMLAGDRPFRFGHGLIRDVAYGTVTKTGRAELHRAFADWVARRGADDAGPIRAYHLERAASLLRELDARDPSLEVEAAEALQEAGERALRASAFATARRLLSRADDLEPSPRRHFLAASAAVELGDLGAVACEMENVREQAEAAGDAFLVGRALNALAYVALARDGNATESERLAEQGFATLPPDDVEGRVQSLFRLTAAAWWPGDVTRAEDYTRRALELAGQRPFLRARTLRTLMWLLEVRLELDEAAEVLALLDATAGDVVERARVQYAEASLRRVQGRLDEAQAGLGEARSTYVDAGLAVDAAWAGILIGWIEFARGDLDGAERCFREGMRVFAESEDRGRLCEAERGLAEVLLEHGRVAEAERLALQAREHVSHHDVTSSVATLRTLSLVRTAQGRDDEAEALLREALDVVSGTDCKLLEVGAAAALARLLRARGGDAEADELEETLPDPLPGWLNRDDALDGGGPLSARPREALRRTAS